MVRVVNIFQNKFQGRDQTTVLCHCSEIRASHRRLWVVPLFSEFKANLHLVSEGCLVEMNEISMKIDIQMFMRL